MIYRAHGRKDPAAVEAARKQAAKYDEGLQETIAPEAIADTANAYIDECIEQGRRPTLEGLAARLDVTSDVVRRWLKPPEDGRDRYRGQRIAAKKAMDRMSDLVQQGKDPMSIFLLKQPHLGGFADKPTTTDGGDTVHIKVSFGGRKG